MISLGKESYLVVHLWMVRGLDSFNFLPGFSESLIWCACGQDRCLVDMLGGLGVSWSFVFLFSILHQSSVFYQIWLQLMKFVIQLSAFWINLFQRLPYLNPFGNQHKLVFDVTGYSPCVQGGQSGCDCLVLWIFRFIEVYSRWISALQNIRSD